MFDRVLELADVSGPVIGFQRCRSIGINGRGLLALQGLFAQYVVDERQDILPGGAQLIADYI